MVSVRKFPIDLDPDWELWKSFFYRLRNRKLVHLTQSMRSLHTATQNHTKASTDLERAVMLAKGDQHQ